jgi:hypothetical protein
VNSTWLYGIEVTSPFPLFATPTSASTRAPGDHAPVNMRAQAEAETQAGAGAETEAQAEGPASAPVQPHSELGEELSFSMTHGRELFLRTDRPLADSAPGQPWCLEVAKVARFSWTGAHNTVYYELLEEGEQRLLAFWFVHIFLPLHLTLERGYDFLHASAVEVNGRPVLFIAPSTGGKSTLADYFLQRGHALLSDDKVATFLHDGDYWAAPSHPHHRPWREDEVLGQPVENFVALANPISAIYCLQPDEPDAAVRISEVSGFRKFEELLPNYLFSFDYLRARRLAWLGQMAAATPVYHLHRPWNLERMEEVYQAVLNHQA